MALETLSSFKYGYTFGPDNKFLQVEDENGIINFTFPEGDLCPSDLSLKVCQLFEATSAAARDYNLLFDPSNCTVKLQRDSGLPFTILSNTGTLASQGVYEDWGLDTSADLTGQSCYQGMKQIGKNFIPQVYLQDYISCENNRSLRNSTKSVSSTGECCEILHCGYDEIFSFEIKAQTNIEQTCRFIRNAKGLDELKDFMDWAICGKCIDFAPDCSKPEIRYKIKLERTPNSRDGTGYRLTEMLRTLGCGYFRTGRLEFRCIEKPDIEAIEMKDM